MMITKILVANRGEIAVRIIRACRELKIQTVAIYADVDCEALHVKLADEAICIGGFKLEESYLNGPAIIQAAVNCQAQAIHPGFGFLSENSDFAKRCVESNIIFIGPSHDLIARMGDKNTARATMRNLGLPVVEGSKDLIHTLDDAHEAAKRLGFPVIIKATAGGGGKGMRIAQDLEHLETAFIQAQSEAKAVFGKGDVYIERYLMNPRHVEIQVLGDQYGNVVHLFERECSLQLRNQKVIEEAPVLNIERKQLEQIAKQCVEVCKQIGYVSAGTFEFMVDENDCFYFIEMNTRIQVEHPVTEMITGVDIVQEQIRIAEGYPLSMKQSDVSIRGHALELRLNAVNCEQGFTPSTGTIQQIHFPGGNGVRIDSAIFQGAPVLPFYDAMIAKIIVFGKNRDVAIEKALRCIEEVDVEGVDVNANFLLDLLLHPDFLDNKATTRLIAEHLKKEGFDV